MDATNKPGKEEPRTHTLLSICVIGRDEAPHLPALIQSLRPLSDLPFPVETIYVDSASSDDSVAIASSFFEQVYVLRDSAHLCASAGRHIGTRMAGGDWILYLDGDMTLRPEFMEVVRRTCLGGDLSKGWIGKYRYIYDNGQVRDNALRHADRGKPVNHFGGAVLLPRTAVIAAGNWNPCIVSNEEIELYTRLRALQYDVYFSDTCMIDHFTPYYPKWQILVDNFLPNSRLGKKYYGFGQVLATRISNKSLFSLIRYFPYPFIYWTGIISSLILLLLGDSYLAGICLSLAFAYVWLTKGISFIALYTAFLPQACLGFSTLSPRDTPEISHAILAHETKASYRSDGDR